NTQRRSSGSLRTRNCTSTGRMGRIGGMGWIGSAGWVRIGSPPSGPSCLPLPSRPSCPSRLSFPFRLSCPCCLSCHLSIGLLCYLVLLELLVEIAARRADDFRGLRDVPAVLAQLAHQKR